MLNDRDRTEELWEEPSRAWFPDGMDDPDLSIVAVRPDHGEYRDQHGVNQVEYALKVARAYVTGDPPTPGSGEHGTTRL